MMIPNIPICFKLVLLLICFYGLPNDCSAQSNGSDFEVKVVSYRYRTTKGYLKKLAAEGIGIEDTKGNYIIFRTADIEKIKVKRRGLGFGRAVSTGTLAGLGIGAGIWSLDENGNNTTDMFKLTVALTATGAVVGTAVGAVAEWTNRRLTLKINGNQDYFNKNYQRLSKYINNSPATLHLSD